MSNNSSITFEDFLNKFSEGEWFEAVEAIAPRIHEVDRNATRIWFRFFPLGLHRYLQAAEDKEEAIHRFVLQGKYELKDQIDTSHHFLYGHRYWKTVKAEIEAEGESFAGGDGSLETLVSRIAERSAEKRKRTYRSCWV